MKRPRRKELALPSLWSGSQEQALRMRRQPTPAEERLWQELRNGRVDGLRFRRQHPVHQFIADFYAVQPGLVVEVDGPVHDEQRDADAERDALLTAMGLTVLRFSNDEVLHQTEEVVDRIRKAIRAAQEFPLSSQGEGDRG